MSEKSQELQKKDDSQGNDDQLVKAGVVAGRFESFSGPLPPPTVLEKYDQILPGAAERIIKMAERQSEHRRGMEAKNLNSDIINSKLGLAFGFIIAMTGIISGAIVIVKSSEVVVGGVISFSSLAALVGVFIYGSRERKLERKERREELKEIKEKIIQGED